jgi:nucleic acid/nucleotide deaminase of polymorphic system toxin
MIESNTREAAVVINREPCGEQFGRGCHQALAAFLPAGFRLTVLGTRGGERYFEYSYEGKAF